MAENHENDRKAADWQLMETATEAHWTAVAVFTSVVARQRRANICK
jgi:hypothetical protein